MPKTLLEEILTLPLPEGTRTLTPAQWTALERYLDRWKRQTLQAAKKHPADGYRLGWQQAQAFAGLLSNLQGTAMAAGGSFGGVSPTMTEAAKWAQTYTLHELNDSLNAYTGQVKDALLYGLRHGHNPTEIARNLYKATRDASVDWRRIARTEMVRANAIGRMEASRAMGYSEVWVPPHVGACEDCKRLLEGKVFAIDELLGATNYGRPRQDWVAALPLHPNCRHGALAYEPSVVDAAHAMYERMGTAGLTDRATIDEMFDSSGQLKKTAGETGDLLDVYAEGLLAVLVAKTRPRGEGQLERVPILDIRTDLHQRPVLPDHVLEILAALRRGEDVPPIDVTRDPGTGQLWCWDGQHRLWARRLHGESTVEAYVMPGTPYDDDGRPLREAMGKVWSPLGFPFDPDGNLDVAKDEGDVPTDVPTDVPAALLFDDAGELRPDVGMACEQWWAGVAGKDWNGWSSIYVPRDQPVLQVRVDYPGLRRARPQWAKLSDPDLHLALVAVARTAASRIAPGLTDVRVWPVDRNAPGSPPAHADGPVWSISEARWLDAPAAADEPRLLGSDEYQALVETPE